MSKFSSLSDLLSNESRDLLFAVLKKKLLC